MCIQVIIYFQDHTYQTTPQDQYKIHIQNYIHYNHNFQSQYEMLDTQDITKFLIFFLSFLYPSLSISAIYYFSPPFSEGPLP